MSHAHKVLLLGKSVVCTILNNYHKRQSSESLTYHYAYMYQVLTRSQCQFLAMLEHHISETHQSTSGVWEIAFVQVRSPYLHLYLHIPCCKPVLLHAEAVEVDGAVALVVALRTIGGGPGSMMLGFIFNAGDAGDL